MANTLVESANTQSLAMAMADKLAIDQFLQEREFELYCANSNALVGASLYAS